jgi:hypothetical protein
MMNSMSLTKSRNVNYFCYLCFLYLLFYFLCFCIEALRYNYVSMSVISISVNIKLCELIAELKHIL